MNSLIEKHCNIEITHDVLCTSRSRTPHTRNILKLMSQTAIALGLNNVLHCLLNTMLIHVKNCL